MEFKRETGAACKIVCDVLTVGIFQDEKIKESLKKLDELFPDKLIGLLSLECSHESFSGKTGQSVTMPTDGQISAKRLILRGLGKRADFSPAVVRKAVAATAKQLQAGNNAPSVAFEVFGLDQAEMVQSAIEGWILGSYQFSKYKSESKKPSKTNKLIIACQGVSNREFLLVTERGQAIANATNFARDMVAEPASFMTPSKLAEIAQSISGKKLTCRIIEKNEAEKLGMGAFLGVARAASEPAKFIVLHYTHPSAKKTIALAGKGITFDSGGLSIKPALGMEHMKYDMSGAAAVIAVMKAISELKPAVNVLTVAAATENMVSATALHPGDILKAMNGKTIEVNNTDAEGRLVLADALCFLSKEEPTEIIDIATLTGAVVTALGRAAAGIMGNNEQLIKRLITSGAAAGEKYWQLPLFDEYKETLKSDIADLKNAGARGEAPSSSAGMFLQEFIGNTAWAHLDIAGPGWLEKGKDELNKGGTAFGVRTLCYYILSQTK